MKAALVFTVRVLVLTLVLMVVFTIASKVSGVAQAAYPSAQAAPTPTAPAQQAALLLGPLLAYAFLVSLVTGCVIQRSRWRGLKLIATMVFTCYGLMTVMSQIETVIYLRARMPPGLIEKLFVMGAIEAVLFVPLAVLIMGRIRGPETPAGKPTLALKSLAARFGILAFVYLVLYYLFGYYVAWQNPALRMYYSGTTELKSFFEVMQTNVTGTPWMLPIQFGRGLLWAMFAYPVVRMMNGNRIEATGIISMLFGVWSFALLIPNPLMPASVAYSHFRETLGSNLLLGALVGWVLAVGAKPGSQGQGQVSAMRVMRLGRFFF